MTYLLRNKPYIPKEIKDEKGPILLHISDTPEESYNYVIKVIENINPQYIVHTGDIVDNIKLETRKSYLPLYEKGSKKFIDFIENYSATSYYVMGNHDDINVVKTFLNKGIILGKGVIEIEGKTFFVSHEYEKSNVKVDYYLFGHSFDPFHYKKGNEIGLNGLISMNAIALSTGKIYQIEYPYGVNYYRKMERRSIGLWFSQIASMEV